MEQSTGVKRTRSKTTTSKNRVEIPLTQTTYVDADFIEKVQKKAYELFLARGCTHGYDVEDWITTEQIIKSA